MKRAAAKSGAWRATGPPLTCVGAGATRSWRGPVFGNVPRGFAACWTATRCAVFATTMSCSASMTRSWNARYRVLGDAPCPRRAALPTTTVSHTQPAANAVASSSHGSPDTKALWLGARNVHIWTTATTADRSIRSKTTNRALSARRRIAEASHTVARRANTAEISPPLMHRQ
jgi:hypothetical protein